MTARPGWTWIDDLNETPVPAIIARFGLETRGNRLWPCPSCNEETASSKERRKGPVTFRDEGWHCWRCGEHGRALELAAWVLLGEAKPATGDSEGWARFGELYTGKIRDNAHDHRTLSVRARSPGPINRTQTSVRARSPGPINPRPDIRELKKLWTSCIPVTEDPEVAAWLESRGFNPRHIAGPDLARALPADVPCPRWASFMGERWGWSGHRLIFRAVGPSPIPSRAGWAWSLRARNIQPDIEGHQKSASAACGPGSATGLVYADDYARQMLVGSRACRMIITEGEPDWLVWASRMAATHPRHRWGVLGVWNGSWTDEIAAQFSRGASVVLRTHRDTAASKFAGQRYADKIEASLLPRGVWVHRLVGEGPDENDAMQAGTLDIEPRHHCVRRELRGRVG